MKLILGLDLGPNSIGWALVNEAESDNEQSSIIKLGVRIPQLTSEEKEQFNKQKGISKNAERTLKRGMRRNLQRYKLRRANFIDTLIDRGWITRDTILSEHGNKTTFETYRLRAKAVSQEISLEEFARVLLMLNKKRGYKSNRKANSNSDEDGSFVDSIDVAKKLSDEHLTPGQYCYQLLRRGKKHFPAFYKSDLQAEFDKIWSVQSAFYPEQLDAATKANIIGKNKKQTWAILAKQCNLVGIKRPSNKEELTLQNYTWRADAVTKRLSLEEIAIVLQEINGELVVSSGYLGKISDHSKELLFNHQTVGQYLMAQLDKSPNVSLKNIIFYRQDYIDEFETIWSKQAEFHPELTDDLKREIRDEVIFYQRRLKSQKGLVGFCEFEQKQISVEKNGQTKEITIGYKQIPKSSPLFQEFKIWHTLNNVQVSLLGVRSRKPKYIGANLFSDLSVNEDLYNNGSRFLTKEEKEVLARELSVKEKLSKTEVLKLLFKDYKSLDLNYREIQGNSTGAKFYSAYAKIIELSGHKPINFKDPVDDITDEVSSVFHSLGWHTDFLKFDSSLPLESQSYYRLWHLLYSFESDNTPTGNGKLKDKIVELCGIDREYADIIADITFDSDYGNLSAKAIKGILPYMKDGLIYDKACEKAGYRHSASSLTKDEIETKELKDHLSILPKNSLRNPVVEKVLNQMVNVVNQLIDTYGRPDEIRVELARELKKNAKERRELTESIAKATNDMADYKEILQKEFGLQHVSRNDIIRYRLYKELKGNGYHTLYSKTYIPKKELFGKNFDIEHIIPQARLFDDSFSNKTLELKSVNIEKGDKTAYDYVSATNIGGGVSEYVARCENLFPPHSAKLRKLLMREQDIPEGFIDRDLRNTQYIAKKALSMLSEVCRRVSSTTGAITDQLRQDWQLVDVMKELNWEKYKAAGLVEYFTDRDGRVIGKIKEWTKRNDHRHHAMDALTVAFTKPIFVQYFNNKNASTKPNSNEYAIKAKYVQNGKVISPIPLNKFRAEAERQLQDILISLQAKNKVATRNQNKTKTATSGYNVRQQLTPRGQLHNETIYGSHLEYICTEDKVNASFDEQKIMTVANQEIRNALLKRFIENGRDAKKAFTGKNALDKNPIPVNLSDGPTTVPTKVKTVTLQQVYTIRKPISENLPIDKVVDAGIRELLKKRVEEYGSAKAAFSNLDKDPIWINKEKGICVKRVAIWAAVNPLAIRDKRDKDGNLIVNEHGAHVPNDFVCPSSNHHVAIYRKPMTDKQGLPILDSDGLPKQELVEQVVSFIEAVARVNQGQPPIARDFKSNEGWTLLFTMKPNEYFVFPNEETGFNPNDVDLMDPRNYALISPNLFRVQKLSSKDYYFRHHLETTVDNNKTLHGKTWKRICSVTGLEGIVKVRVNHLGQIVAVGEY
jgi:CRISPR-associated endonuclease Csn1